MDIVHVSAECYPVAKAGGLGDVVGALPKYQNKLGHNAKVIMPMYRTKFLINNEWEVVHEAHQNLGDYHFKYAVIREKTNKLGFELYLVDIFGLLDREKVYGYDDDTDRLRFATGSHNGVTNRMLFIVMTIIQALFLSCCGIVMPSGNSKMFRLCLPFTTGNTRDSLVGAVPI